MRTPLDRERLRSSTPGFSVLVTDETASTNADLATAAREGAPAWSVHTTDHQASGRGRLDRSFTMPPLTGVAVSTLIRPTEVPARRWPWLPLVAGIAVVDTVRSVGVDVGLKWPNDVLTGDDRKLCGILVERVETPQGPAAIIGIGLNVGLTREELPVPTATSLLLERASSTDRTALVATLLSNLRDRVELWRDPARADELADVYTAMCTTLGREVRIERADGSFVDGTATGVDESGCLVVDDVAWSAGDVTHLRPR